MAFGHGIHFCLAAALARLEGEIVLRTLLDRFPTMRLSTTNLEWEKNMRLRALQAVPVAVTRCALASPEEMMLHWLDSHAATTS